MKLDNFYLEDGTLLEFTDGVARENISKHAQLIANIDAAIQAYTKETTSSIEAILTTIKDKADTKSLNNYLPLTAGSSKPLTDDLYITSGKYLRLGEHAFIRGDDTDGRLTISAGKDRILTIKPNPGNSTGQMHIYGTVFRPGAKDGVQLGSDSAPWSAIYGTTLYQNGKQVANKEEIPTNITLLKINEGIEVIDNGLTYSRGLVEIRKVGDILWIIDNGVYNFTDNFTTKNSRTVLQFTLPKELSNRLCNTNGVFGTTGTIGYFPALAYENVTYTTFNCQSYLKRSTIGETEDTFQLVYTGLNIINGGGLCGFHSKMPLILTPKED